MRLSFVLNLLLLLVSSLFHKAWAQVVAPSSGGGVSIIQIAATTMTLKVGSNGTGQGRVVSIAQSDMPTMLAPTNNQFFIGNSEYSQGSKLGQGYVVYSGTGYSVTITGLQPNTSYYITNAEYNTDGTTIAYNTRGTSISVNTRKAAPTPLPVTLVAFTGSVNAQSIATLRWITASESNSSYFALERSTDGITFAGATQVTAAGSSSQERAYQWTDTQVLYNITYYRLRQVDQDGATHYSSIVALAPTAQISQQFDVYPNPGTNQSMLLSLQGFEGQQLTMQLHDAFGKAVMQTTVMPITASYLAPINPAGNIAAGTYILTISGRGLPIQKRVTIID